MTTLVSQEPAPTPHPAPTPASPTTDRPSHVIGEIVIDRRHNGPQRSGNGGVAAGRIAEFVSGPATVVLRRPVPLARRLTVWDDGAGGVGVRVGRSLVAEARAAGVGAVEVAPPRLPSMAEALATSINAFGFEARHPLGWCFVCSRHRRDGLGVLPGMLTQNPDMLAAVYRPRADHGPEMVWAALDCPSYPVSAIRDGRICVLGTQTVEQYADLVPGSAYAVVGWTDARGTRSYRTSSALVDDAGTIVAASNATWVALKGWAGRPRP